MCFFECYKYSCRDWRWGNFRQHCNREWRLGETCDMKLLYCTIDLPNKCTFCEKIETKLRKRERALSDRERWLEEPQRFHASIQKATEDIEVLEREITAAQAEKDRKYQNVGNTKRPSD
ncbi:hypothetical protein CB0940_10652, partial [Cercospora beticola]